MQAVVKTPHIEIQIKGTIPPRILNALQEEYGGKVKLVTDEGEKLVNVFETKWYKDMKQNMTPGKYLRVYRENKGLTQSQLGAALGGVPKQHISNMENGKRAISLRMARQLAKVLDAALERFIEE